MTQEPNSTAARQVPWLRPSGRLEGKVTIVSGGGSTAIENVVGIGRAIATVFGQEGAPVAVADIDLGRAEETCDAIQRDGGTAVALECDFTKPQQIEAMVARVAQVLGPPQILVNNVGLSDGAGPLEEFDERVYARMHETNLLSAIRTSKCVSPFFIAARQGVYVNISSIGGLTAAGAGIPYATSKAALIAMSRELALMYGKYGVRSNAIAPGSVYTTHVVGRMSAQARELRRKVSPLGIEGTAWDVAQAAAFLASDAARYITGTCLVVDGGATALGPFAAHRLLTDS
jgi:NAD(P)-dependent dehydrogenase (short-subunit alcohol dehydrogenase family)